MERFETELKKLCRERGYSYDTMKDRCKRIFQEIEKTAKDGKKIETPIGVLEAVEIRARVNPFDPQMIIPSHKRLILT